MAGEHLLRAYGDRRDDGVIQLSFTLPVPLSDKAKEAARRFCAQLGLLDVKVAAAEAAADNYTFFVVYARADVSLDYAAIDVPEVFRWLAREGGVAEPEMLRTFNCGIGMVVVVAREGADEALSALREAGEAPVVLGEIVAASGERRVLYRGKLAL